MVRFLGMPARRSGVPLIAHLHAQPRERERRHAPAHERRLRSLLAGREERQPHDDAIHFALVDVLQHLHRQLIHRPVPERIERQGNARVFIKKGHPRLAGADVESEEAHALTSLQRAEP